jgi:hypothetical protein
VTYDLAEAREWFEVLPAAMGVEGLVLKPTAARYAGCRRSSWAKVNSAGVRRVRFANAAGVVPAQHAARRSPIVRDGCRGRVGGVMAELVAGLPRPADFGNGRHFARRAHQGSSSDHWINDRVRASDETDQVLRYVRP